jgi:hypothetical protein
MKITQVVVGPPPFPALFKGGLKTSFPKLFRMEKEFAALGQVL